MRICVVKYNTKTGVSQLQGVSFHIKDKRESERTPGPSVHECSVLQLCLTYIYPLYGMKLLVAEIRLSSCCILQHKSSCIAVRGLDLGLGAIYVISP